MFGITLYNLTLRFIKWEEFIITHTGLSLKTSSPASRSPQQQRATDHISTVRKDMKLQIASLYLLIDCAYSSTICTSFAYVAEDLNAAAKSAFRGARAALSSPRKSNHLHHMLLR